MNKYKKNLKKLVKKHRKFKCAFIHGSGFWQHLECPTDTHSKFYIDNETITDRQIFDDEIVIETDKALRATNRALSRRIIKNMMDYNWDRWFSGNKSYHIHLKFPELARIEDSYKRRMLKELFIRYVTDCPILVPQVPLCSYCFYDKCFVSKKKVDLMLCTKHMIRLEYAQHPHTGHRKELIDENENGSVNKLPREIINIQRYIYNNTNNNTISNSKYCNKNNMGCVKYFATHNIPDCKKRVLFILCNYLSLEELHTWNNTLMPCINTHLIDYLSEYHSHTNKKPRCNYIKYILRELQLLHLCNKCTVNIKQK